MIRAGKAKGEGDRLFFSGHDLVLSLVPTKIPICICQHLGSFPRSCGDSGLKRGSAGGQALHSALPVLCHFSLAKISSPSSNPSTTICILSASAVVGTQGAWGHPYFLLLRALARPPPGHAPLVQNELMTDTSRRCPREAPPVILNSGLFRKGRQGRHWPHTKFRYTEYVFQSEGTALA